MAHRGSGDSPGGASDADAMSEESPAWDTIRGETHSFDDSQTAPPAHTAEPKMTTTQSSSQPPENPLLEPHADPEPLQPRTAETRETCEICKIIQLHYVSLVEEMRHVDWIVDQLVEEGCVTKNELVEINKGGKDNELERKRQLLLLHKTNTHRGLARALLLSGQGELCRKVWKGEDMSGESCPTLQYKVWCLDQEGKESVKLSGDLTSLKTPPHLMKKLRDNEEEIITNLSHVNEIIEQLQNVICLKKRLADDLLGVSREEQVRSLLGALGDLSTYLMFVECLKATNQKVLYRMLHENGMPGLDTSLTDSIRF